MNKMTKIDKNDAKVSQLPAKSPVKKDLNNIILLMFLYFLQAVPLGLTGSLPYILSSHKVSYAEQGTFSFAFWPFSLKLLWAPVVDSIFIRKFGRRKSWLIPIQYLIGLYMIYFSSHVSDILDNHRSDDRSILFSLISPNPNPNPMFINLSS